MLRGEENLLLVFQVNHGSLLPSMTDFIHQAFLGYFITFKELESNLQELQPPVKMLVPVWKALCAATDGKEISSS